MKAQTPLSSQSQPPQPDGSEQQAKEEAALELGRLWELQQEALDRIAKEQRILQVLESRKKSVQQEISERKKYLAEQEKLIADAVDEGNASLRGIGYEIQAEQQKRDELRNEIAELETMRTNAAFEKIQAEMELAYALSQKNAASQNIPHAF